MSQYKGTYLPAQVTQNNAKWGQDTMLSLINQGANKIVTVFPPHGTYFVTTDAAPLGAADGLTFCRELPARCGVVAVPNSVFYDDVDYALRIRAAGFPTLQFQWSDQGDAEDLFEAILAPAIFVLPPLLAVLVVGLAQTFSEGCSASIPSRPPSTWPSGWPRRPPAAWS